MYRRHFLKGMLLAAPALWLAPGAGAQWIASQFTSTSNHGGPFFVFIGAFGQSVLGHLKPLQHQHTIIRPCRHVAGEINLIDMFS